MIESCIMIDNTSEIVKYFQWRAPVGFYICVISTTTTTTTNNENNDNNNINSNTNTNNSNSSMQY